MDDKNKKWIKWVVIILMLPIILILLLLFVLIFTATMLSSSDRGNYSGDRFTLFSDKAGEMFNIETLAKEEDQERFLHYQVVDMPSDSKEFIAVRFNTMDEKNIGIIDEYGNVIKEPFLRDEVDCYCGKYDPPLNKHINYGNYIDLTYYNGGMYNLDLEQITMSEEEKEEWDKNEHSRETHTKIDFKVNSKEIVKIYEYFENPKNYKLLNLVKIGEGGIYSADFIYPDDFLSTYYTILIDENHDLVSHIYYSTHDMPMFSVPSEGSKIGMAFIEDLGMVYFNIDGEIIWITYCDQTTPDQCE